jgi:hypothetical protein
MFRVLALIFRGGNPNRLLISLPLTSMDVVGLHVIARFYSSNELCGERFMTHAVSSLPEGTQMLTEDDAI